MGNFKAQISVGSSYLRYFGNIPVEPYVINVQPTTLSIVSDKEDVLA